jgi:hypothetical protein
LFYGRNIKIEEKMRKKNKNKRREQAKKTRQGNN